MTVSTNKINLKYILLLTYIHTIHNNLLSNNSNSNNDNNNTPDLENQMPNTTSTSNPFLFTNENKRNLQENTNFKQIRITIDNTTIIKQVEMGLVDNTYVGNILKTLALSIKALRFILRVIPYDGNLSVEHCHREIIINPNIIGIGYQTDLIIFPFINLNETDSVNIKGNTYGEHCSRGLDGRPIAGYLSISKNFMFNKIKANEYYSHILFHSLIHIVGFDENLFDYYVFKGTNITKGINNIITEQSGDSGSKRVFFSEENVKITAQKYFNCNSIIGIPLITKKYDNSISTHWNSRYMLGDIMIEMIYADMVLSEITLAVLESTGWYEVNYFTGGLFRFGKNAGCDFIDKACLKYGHTDFTNEFCTKKGLFMCSAGRLSRGICYINDNLDQSISKKNNLFLFSEPNKGGLSITEYCPVSTPNIEMNDYIFSDSCSIGDSIYSNSFGEVISTDSACFLTNLFLKNDPGIQTFSKQMTAVCYEYICDSSTRKYKIKIKENIYECEDGGKIIKQTTEGELQCPGYSLICTKSVACSTMLDCIFKGSLNISTMSILQNEVKNGQETKGKEMNPTRLESEMMKYEQSKNFIVGVLKQNTHSYFKLRMVDLVSYMILYIIILNI